MSPWTPCRKLEFRAVMAPRVGASEAGRQGDGATPYVARRLLGDDAGARHGQRAAVTFPRFICRQESPQRPREAVTFILFPASVVDPGGGQPWYFSINGKGQKALNKFAEQKPYMLIGSSQCTAFSTWMALNDAERKDLAAARGAKSTL